MTRQRPFRSRRVLCSVVALLCLVGITTPAWAQFETRATHALPNESFGVVAGDFNRDGKLDIAVIGDYLSVLMGNGDGTFQAPVNYTAVGQTIAVSDFNGDGNLDLVIGNENNSVSVFLGNGDGTFQPPKSSSTTASCCSFIAVGDFNGDHKMDIAVIDGQYISVLLGNGDGTFQAPSDNNSFVGAHQLAVGDFNNDRKLDVAVVGYFGGSQDLGILLGNGDGTLQASLTYPLTYLPVEVAAADFNGDGNLDVAVGGGGAVTVLLGNGDGTFGSPQTYSGGGCCRLIVGDFNQDGKLDLITGPSVGPGVAEFLGNGDGTFQPAKIYVSGSGSPAAAGDFNGDHRPDVILLDGNHDKVTSMLNTGALSFSPSTPLSFQVAQLVGTTSAPENVTLTNTGAAAVSIQSIAASLPFQTSSTCGGRIAAGANCAVSVVFAPTMAGPRPGLVSLYDSASSKPQIIELSGRGTFVALSPSSLSFGPQKVGTTSLPKRLSVTNEGGTSVTISSIGMGGANAKDFAVTGTGNCTGQALAPGATCNVAVTFAPKKTGTRSATVFVNDSGAGSPETVALSGTGT
jgi:hypothetical protein